LNIKVIFIIFLSLLFLFYLMTDNVFAYDDLIQEQLDIIDSTEINSFLEEMNDKYSEYLPKHEFKDLVNSFKSKKIYNIKGILSGLSNYFFHELTANYHLLGQLIALSVVSAVLRNFQNAFENNSISKVAYSVVYLVLMVVAIQSFAIALRVGKEAIEQMVSFIQALLPVLFTLLASIGGFTSVAVFKPLIFIGITVASTWIKNILMPILFLTAVLGLVNNISDRFHVSFLASFLKQICVFLLGLFLCIFLGTLATQGAASATMDGISIRTAKFASKNFIPIVGGIFSDTVDTIVSCSLILKNAVGLIGLLTVFLLTVFPVAKILSIVFVYKIAAAIIQPVGEELIVKCLNDMSNSMMLILLSIAAVSAMFFIAITVILSAGSITIMMR
jgi:stage III sporulation protein AE